MKSKITLTMLAILLAIFFSNAQTIVPPGAVEGTWTLSNSPYRVDSAIYVANSRTLTIEAGVVVKFKTTERFEIDGCLLAEGTVEDSILFTSHDPLIRWGGIKWIETLSANDSSKIAYCIFEQAYAYGPEQGLNSGGAIAIKEFDKLSIQNSTFRFNKVDQAGVKPPSGGAIGLWTSSVYISHCVFHNNEAKYGGAIIYVYGSNATTDNCLFYNNTATAYGGALELFDASNPYLINCTFADNQAALGGDAIDVFESVPILTNSIVWNNDQDTLPDQIHMRYYATGLNVFNSNIQGGEDGFSGYNNIGELQKMTDTIPCFMGEGELYPYAIDTNSPCADYGTLNTACLPENWTCPLWDLADQPRRDGNNIDLGAYETQLQTVIPEQIDNQDLKLSVFPNPTSNSLTIKYVNPLNNHVNIDLYTIAGKRIKPIVNQIMTPGKKQQQINLNGVPAGFYLLKLQVGNTAITRRVIKY